MDDFERGLSQGETATAPDFADPLELEYGMQLYVEHGLAGANAWQAEQEGLIPLDDHHEVALWQYGYAMGALDRREGKGPDIDTGREAAIIGDGYRAGRVVNT